MTGWQLLLQFLTRKTILNRLSCNEFQKKLKGRGTGKEPKTVHSCRFHRIMTTLGKLLKTEFERGELEKSRLYKNISVHHPLGRQGVESMRRRGRSPSTPKSAPEIIVINNDIDNQNNKWNSTLFFF